MDERERELAEKEMVRLARRTVRWWLVKRAAGGVVTPVRMAVAIMVWMAVDLAAGWVVAWCVIAGAVIVSFTGRLIVAALR